MKSLDSQEATNKITGFLYFWRSDKIRRIGRILDMDLHPVCRLEARLKWSLMRDDDCLRWTHISLTIIQLTA